MPEPGASGASTLAEENLKRLSRVRGEADFARRFQTLEEKQRQMALDVEAFGRAQGDLLQRRLAEVRERIEAVPREVERLRETEMAAEHRRWEDFRALLRGEEIPARLARIQEGLAQLEQEAGQVQTLRKEMEETAGRAEAAARKQRSVETSLNLMEREAAELKVALETVRKQAEEVRAEAGASGQEALGRLEALKGVAESTARSGEERMADMARRLEEVSARTAQVAERAGALESLRQQAEEAAATLPKEMERLVSLAEKAKTRMEGLEAQVHSQAGDLKARLAGAEERLKGLSAQTAAGEEGVRGVLALAEEARQKVASAFDQVPLELQALKDSVAGALGGARERVKNLEAVASAAPEALRRGEEAARRLEEFLGRTGELAREAKSAEERWNRLESRLAELEGKIVERAEFEALTKELKAFFDDLIRERERALGGAASAQEG